MSGKIKVNYGVYNVLLFKVNDVMINLVKCGMLFC